MGKVDADCLDRAKAAPWRHATAKHTGKLWRAPAVTGWRICRLHDAGGGQRPGPPHPNYLHGERSREAVALRALVGRLVRESCDLLPRLD